MSAELAVPSAELSRWEEVVSKLQAEEAALFEQLRQKQAERAQAASHASREQAAVDAVGARFAKQRKRLEAKSEGLAAAESLFVRAESEHAERVSAHESELTLVESEAQEHRARVEEAEAALECGSTELSKHAARHALVQRAAQAAAALRSHEAHEAEQLGGLLDELNGCRAAHRAHGDRCLAILAEVQLLTNQLGGIQDQASLASLTQHQSHSASDLLSIRLTQHQSHSLALALPPNCPLSLSFTLPFFCSFPPSRHPLPKYTTDLMPFFLCNRLLFSSCRASD